MIGYLEGKVLFSDGTETIILTNSGIGHQVFYYKVLVEGQNSNLYISHIVRENSEVLYGFQTLREKKLFETLNSVKGVGPKSAYALICTVGVSQIIDSIAFDNKKILTQAPGVGNKAASQIALDLKEKIQKFRMYSSLNESELDETNERPTKSAHQYNKDGELLEETIMACKELGFREDKVMQLANKILLESSVTKSEQLVHLVLKEI